MNAAQAMSQLLLLIIITFEEVKDHAFSSVMMFVRKLLRKLGEKIQEIQTKYFWWVERNDLLEVGCNMDQNQDSRVSGSGSSKALALSDCF